MIRQSGQKGVTSKETTLFVWCMSNVLGWLARKVLNVSVESMALTLSTLFRLSSFAGQSPNSMRKCLIWYLVVKRRRQAQHEIHKWTRVWAVQRSNSWNLSREPWKVLFMNMAPCKRRAATGCIILLYAVAGRTTIPIKRQHPTRLLLVTPFYLMSFACV